MMENPRLEFKNLVTKTKTEENEEHFPRCRSDFTAADLEKFIETIVPLVYKQQDLNDLVILYRLAKQISRTFTQCPELRLHVAACLKENRFSSTATRIIKRLNHLGVFSNDNTWFASFYFYNIAWNYTDISPDVATALAVSGLSHLLNLNIGHPAYLENISSKNVYFLLKASVSILHNISKIPGNRDMAQYPIGRDAMVHVLTLQDEDSLRCVSALCLAHVISEEDLDMVLHRADEQPNLLKILAHHLYSASNSPKRKHHGFLMIDLMTALADFLVNEPVQSLLFETNVEKIITRNPKSQTKGPPTISCMKFLLYLTDNYRLPVRDVLLEREANQAVRILYHLIFNKSLRQDVLMEEAMKHVSELSDHPVTSSTSITKDMFLRTLEMIFWQHSRPPCPTTMTHFSIPEPDACGPVVMSYAPINTPAVTYFVDQLRAAGIPIWNDVEGMVYPEDRAQEIGLSAASASVKSMKEWLHALDSATVMIVCLSDAYRLSPGCRSEVEYFLTMNSESNPKLVVYITLPPKYATCGWVHRLPGVVETIEFTEKRTFIANLQHLVSLVGKLYGITVANEPLEPLSFNLGEGLKEYISLDDLRNLKSSSIFMSSIESHASRLSNAFITQTADQMMSKGSLRFQNSGGLAPPGSSSTTITPFHSSGSFGASHRDYKEVNSIPSTELSEPDRSDPEDAVDVKKPEASNISPKSSLNNIVETTASGIINARVPEESINEDGINLPPTEIVIGERKELDAEEIKNITEKDERPSPITFDFLYCSSERTNTMIEKINTTTGGNSIMSEKLDIQTHFEEKISVNSMAPPTTLIEEIEKPGLGELPMVNVTENLTNSITTFDHALDALDAQVHVKTEDNDVQWQLTESENLLHHKGTGESTLIAAHNMPLAATQTLKTSNAGSLDQNENVVNTSIPESKISNPQKQSFHLTANGAIEEFTADSFQSTSLGHHEIAPSDGTQEAIPFWSESFRASKPTVSNKVVIQSENNVQKPHSSATVDYSMLDDVQTIPTLLSSLQNDGVFEKPPLSRNTTLLANHARQSCSPTAMQSCALLSYEDIVKPHIRGWSVQQVAKWFREKGFPHLSGKFCDQLDGVVLSQLVCLRHWAPEYFAKSVRHDLGLGFIEGLRLVDAMEELTKR